MIMMEIDETLNSTEDCIESFGDISCITPDGNDEKKRQSLQIDADASDQEPSMSVSDQSSEESFDPVAVIEVSDLLGLVGKKWSIFHVSPMWNLNFNTDSLNVLSKKLNNVLLKHIKTNLKNSISQIVVNIESKEAYNEHIIALKIDVNNPETNTQLYTGILLKSPKYAENYDKNNLSDMPVLLAQGNKSITATVQNWLTNHFDCVIRPYEFALYQFLWLIALSMGDAGHFYNENVLYHYLYKYECSKGQMDVKCYVESEFLRSILAKLFLNRSAREATFFHYSDLIKVQSEIDDHFKVTNGIIVSKLKLNAFEAPKVASINASGKIHVFSSNLMDLILKYLMEPENNTCL